MVWAFLQWFCSPPSPPSAWGLRLQALVPGGDDLLAAENTPRTTTYAVESTLYLVHTVDDIHPALP